MKFSPYIETIEICDLQPDDYIVWIVDSYRDEVELVKAETCVSVEDAYFVSDTFCFSETSDILVLRNRNDE